MALSGSYDFTLTGTNLIASIHRKLGIQTANTTQKTNALEAVEVILKALASEGFNLIFPFTQESITQALVASTAAYNQNAKIMHIAQAFIRRDNVDTPVRVISTPEYQAISTKTTEGKPSSLWFNRQHTPVVTLYPVPENATDVLHMVVVNKIQDLDNASNNIDIDSAWFRALLYAGMQDIAPEVGRPDMVSYAERQASIAIAKAKETAGHMQSTIIRMG